MKLSKVSELLNECFITEEDLREMSSIGPAESGLPCVMFMSNKMYVRGKHGPRIKISNVPGTFSSSDNFVVAISNPPRVVAGVPKYKENVVNDILDWVNLNSEALLKGWTDAQASDNYRQELKRL